MLSEDRVNCDAILWVISDETIHSVPLVGRQEGHPFFKKIEWWDAGVVICLGQGAYFA